MRYYYYTTTVSRANYINTGQLERYHINNIPQRIHYWTATCHVQSDPLRRSSETESQGGSPMGEAAENSRDWRHLTPWPALRGWALHTKDTIDVPGCLFKSNKSFTRSRFQSNKKATTTSSRSRLQNMSKCSVRTAHAPCPSSPQNIQKSPQNSGKGG